MSLSELKALTKEEVHHLGLTPHDLWLIKEQDEIHGPYEVETLKKYCFQNQMHCEELHASRLEHTDWQPFYDHAVFQRRHPKVVKTPEHFWLLIQGQKSGPHVIADIEKKLQTEVISLADLISTDHGESWHKIYQHEAFASHRHSADELPKAPSVESLKSSEKEISHVVSSKEAIAGWTHLSLIQNKNANPKLEEMTIQSLHTSEITRSIKWAAPMAVGVVACVLVAGHYVMSPSMQAEEVSEESQTQMARSEVILPKRAMPKAHSGIPQQSERYPATSVPHHERSALTQPNYDAYNTHQETLPEHNPDESMDHHQAPQEHSLVGSPGTPMQDEYGHQEAPATPAEPVREVASEIPAAPVEESSDF